MAFNPNINPRLNPNHAWEFVDWHQLFLPRDNPYLIDLYRKFKRSEFLMAQTHNLIYEFSLQRVEALRTDPTVDEWFRNIADYGFDWKLPPGKLMEVVNIFNQGRQRAITAIQGKVDLANGSYDEFVRLEATGLGFLAFGTVLEALTLPSTDLAVFRNFANGYTQLNEELVVATGFTNQGGVIHMRAPNGTIQLISRGPSFVRSWISARLGGYQLVPTEVTVDTAALSVSRMSMFARVGIVASRIFRLIGIAGTFLMIAGIIFDIWSSYKQAAESRNEARRFLNDPENRVLRALFEQCQDSNQLAYVKQNTNPTLIWGWEAAAQFRPTTPGDGRPGPRDISGYSIATQFSWDNYMVRLYCLALQIDSFSEWSVIDNGTTAIVMTPTEAAIAGRWNEAFEGNKQQLVRLMGQITTLLEDPIEQIELPPAYVPPPKPPVNPPKPPPATYDPNNDPIIIPPNDPDYEDPADNPPPVQPPKPPRKPDSNPEPWIPTNPAVPFAPEDNKKPSSLLQILQTYFFNIMKVYERKMNYEDDPFADEFLRTLAYQTGETTNKKGALPAQSMTDNISNFYTRLQSVSPNVYTALLNYSNSYINLLNQISNNSLPPTSGAINDLKSKREALSIMLQAAHDAILTAFASADAVAGDPIDLINAQLRIIDDKITPGIFPITASQIYIALKELDYRFLSPNAVASIQAALSQLLQSGNVSNLGNNSNVSGETKEMAQRSLNAALIQINRIDTPLEQATVRPGQARGLSRPYRMSIFNRRELFVDNQLDLPDYNYLLK